MINYDSFSKGYMGLFDAKYEDLVRGGDNSIDARCMSYAVWKSMQMIMKYSETIAFVMDVEQLPDGLLDYFAIEWMIPYYDAELDIETKRKLLKRGFAWCMEAGTVGAVEKMITMIFGEGIVTEWYEYGGKKGMFKILTNALMTEEINTVFTLMLRRVKNTRSHIEKIEIHRETSMNEYTGGALNTRYRPPVLKENLKEKNKIVATNSMSVVMNTYQRAPQIRESLCDKNMINYTMNSGATILGYQKAPKIIEGLKEQNRIDCEMNTGVAANSYEKAETIKITELST